MKKIITLIVIAAFSINAMGQAIIPAKLTFPKKNRTTPLKATDNLNFDKGFFGTYKLNNNNPRDLKLAEIKRNAISTRMDSIELNAIVDEKNKEDLQLQVDELNKTPKYNLLFNAGLNNLENTKKSYGSGSLGVLVRLSEYKINKKNKIDPHYLYAMVGMRTAIGGDSNLIAKSILFPELNTRDFVLGYFWETIKNDWSTSLNFELSLNKFSDTLTKSTYQTQSFLLGAKFKKSFGADTSGKTNFIELFPYYSLINIDPKYQDDIAKFSKEPSMYSTIHSLGLKVSFLTPNAILFCNMKYILNKPEGIKSPDLVRFVYTIGTTLSL